MKMRFASFLCGLCALALAASALAGSAAASEIPAGRSIREFIAPDGRIDLEAARAAGYEGPLDLDGLDVRIDSSSGLPTVNESYSTALTADPDDEYWKRGPNYQGIDGSVGALAVYNDCLIAAGTFSVACDTLVCNIAAWNGSFWAPLGSGIVGTIVGTRVSALAVYDGKLIAAGFFVTAGGVAASNIAAWDGFSWSPLGSGTSGEIFALAVYAGTLIASGQFSAAGGVAASMVASWDGAAWAPLGAGIAGGWVTTLTECNGLLVAGGRFTTAGGLPANRIASWDGAAWAPLGAGMNEEVFALASFDGKLVAGGVFTTAGDVSASYIAAWDGASWAPMGTAAAGVWELAVFNGSLVAAIGYVVSVWDGAAWSPLGTSRSGVKAMAVFDGALVCGSTFETADGSRACNIAAWDGASWSSLGTGSDGAIYAMIIYGGRLIVGGDFHSIDGVRANNIASWNGYSWEALDSGVNGPVYSLAVYGINLIVGGSFTTAGGVSANSIASWNWGWWSALGTGAVTPVYAMAVCEDKLMVGASGGASYVVRSWNGTEWSTLWSEYYASGIRVTAMTAYYGWLMVGVTYVPGYDEAYKIYMWNGSTRTTILSGSYGGVYALAQYGDRLFAGGTWNVAIHYWTWYDLTWTKIEACEFLCETRAFVTYWGDLVAGGAYYPRDPEPNYFIKKWDGSTWSDFGSGTNGCVRALVDYGDLLVGGQFTIAGGKISTSLARWHEFEPIAVLIAGFDARPVESGIELSWNLSADERVEGYRIYRSGGDDPAETILNEDLLAAAERTYTDLTALPGERYLYALAVLLEDGSEVRSSSVQAERAPIASRLCQNVPNPFNPSTSISFSTDAPERVRLEVYDIGGRLVARLVDEPMTAGQHRIDWDGRDRDGRAAASGVYFYRLTVGKQTFARKMILLR